MSVYRSFLFTPGNHARRVEKALGLDADAVILDLEDAVATSEKEAARGPVAAALAAPRAGLGYARVNAFDTPFCYGDILATVVRGLDGIVLPKVESRAQVIAIDWLLDQLERERGLEPGSVDVIPIIETGLGLEHVAGIATAAPRVRRLAFGAGDFTLDMGMRWTRGERELDAIRSRIAVASRAAGLEAPIDTVFVHLGETEALVRATALARDLGFQGKMCIHPEQIGPVNAVFTPPPEEVELARRQVAAFAAAEAAGSASIQVDGQFIDYPIVAQARRVLAIAAAIEAREGRGL